ncbi:MAG: hypothetical protein AAF985_03615 [Bacteroidota bacterium]
MKNGILNAVLLMVFCLILSSNGFTQNASFPKKEVTEPEKVLIRQLFKAINTSDQLYREKLSTGTLDEAILAKIDSIYEQEGVQAALTYEKSLNLSLPKAVEDSLWNLQAMIDLQNHLILRGLWETYGYIPKEVIEEYNYVQVLLLLHPPRDWDIPTYLKEYSAMLIEEVRAGKMSAFDYASFYDNMKSKILQEPQLYGTNKRFDSKSKSILPPVIQDLEKTNSARKAIGLPELKEGEYELSGK